MDTTPVTMERIVNAPSDTVWQAITDREKMKQWYFDIEAFKPEVGFEFRFYGGTDEKQYLHLCKIKEVVPGRKLSYSWRYEGYPGESLVTFELFPQGDQTKVILTHSGLETFPADNPDMKKENFEAGWKDIIGANLKEFVEKQKVG